MDKDRLRQLRFIKSEVGVLENQIENIKPLTGTDKVKGSSAYFPYIQRSFTVEGVDWEDYNKRVERIRSKLLKRKEELLKLQEEANNYILTIDDSMIRQAITLRYVEGLSWQQAAQKMGGVTPDSIRMAVNRYMDI